MPFGYKQHWLAVQDKEPQAIAGVFSFRYVRAASWTEGMACFDRTGPDVDQTVFITPAIGRWTLAVAGARAIPQARNSDWIPFLEQLSAQLGHVQYFGTHRVVGYVAWAKASQGRLIRAFAYLGESNETLVNLGEPTPEEKEIGIDFLDERTASKEEFDAHEERIRRLEAAIHTFTRDRDPETLTESETNMFDSLIRRYNMTIPDEDSVMLVADRWSLDPMKLDEIPVSHQFGILGSL